MKEKINYIFRKTINFIGSVGYFGLLFICIGTMISTPVTIPFLVVPTLFCAGRTLPALGQYIGNSIFQIHGNLKGEHKIYQNGMAKPVRMLSCVFSKDKGKKISEEAINMFTELERKDLLGNRITYTTTSQSKTKYLLRKAEEVGYIENLKCEPSKCKRLVIEKIMFGNYKLIKKKEKMYKMSFNLTDKIRDKEEILETLHIEDKNKVKKLSR